MSELFKILGQANVGATSNTTLYTVPDLTQTVCSVLPICNLNGAGVTVRVYVVPKGGTTGQAYAILYDHSIAANTTDTTLKGLTLRGGDFVVVYASSASVVFHLFGSEIS